MRIMYWSSDVCSSDLQQFHCGAPDAAATTRHDYRLAAQIRHLSLQQFLIGVPVSLLELEAHGHAIFVGSTSVANNGIVSIDRICPVILVEDIATLVEDSTATILRFLATLSGQERSAIKTQDNIFLVGDGQNDQR